MKGRDLGRVREEGGGKEAGDGGRERRARRRKDGRKHGEDQGRSRKEERRNEEEGRKQGNVATGREENKIIGLWKGGERCIIGIEKEW